MPWLQLLIKKVYMTQTKTVSSLDIKADIYNVSLIVNDIFLFEASFCKKNRKCKFCSKFFPKMFSN